MEGKVALTGLSLLLKYTWFTDVDHRFFRYFARTLTQVPKGLICSALNVRFIMNVCVGDR